MGLPLSCSADLAFALQKGRRMSAMGLGCRVWISVFGWGLDVWLVC